MASGEEFDSGMESQTSKANSPEKLPELMDKEEDEEDETLSERLWGLTEMFPDPVRNLASSLVSGVKTTVVSTYGFSRSVTWAICSSSLILFAPVFFEVERANTQDALRREQQQVLLGPGAGMGGVPPPR